MELGWIWIIGNDGMAKIMGFGVRELGWREWLAVLMNETMG